MLGGGGGGGGGGGRCLRAHWGYHLRGGSLDEPERRRTAPPHHDGIVSARYDVLARRLGRQCHTPPGEAPLEAHPWLLPPWLLHRPAPLAAAHRPPPHAPLRGLPRGLPSLARAGGLAPFPLPLARLAP